MLSKQTGFTVIEVVVSMVIFTVIVIGSGMLMKHSLNVQKEMNRSTFISNYMQERLRLIENAASEADICTQILAIGSFPFDGAVLHIGCAIELVEITNAAGTISTGWPVIAVASSQAIAQACAEGTDADECYIIGR